MIEPDSDDSSRVIDDDDGAALEIVDYLDGAVTRTSPDSHFQTQVAAESTDVPRPVLQRICDAVESHRNAAEEGVFREADLSIAVHDYDPGSRFLRYLFPFFAGGARVKLSVSGAVNGNSVSFSTHPEITAARYVGAFGGSSEKMLEACLQDCIGTLCSVLDTTAGREPPAFARFWGRIRVARWIIALVVFVTFLGSFMALHPAKPGDKDSGGSVFLMIFGGMFAAASTFGIISLGGLLVAPSDFLLRHPAGMRAMTRTGVKSPIALRIVAMLLLLVSFGAIGLSMLMLRDGR
jgi:hypothetical protein